jgi:hypothetical protein
MEDNKDLKKLEEFTQELTSLINPKQKIDVLKTIESLSKPFILNETRTQTDAEGQVERITTIEKETVRSFKEIQSAIEMIYPEYLSKSEIIKLIQWSRNQDFNEKSLELKYKSEEADENFNKLLSVMSKSKKIMTN